MDLLKHRSGAEAPGQVTRQHNHSPQVHPITLHTSLRKVLPDSFKLGSRLNIQSFR